jgi:type I restriction enzyme S subunit
MKRVTVQLGDFLNLKRGYDLPEHARLPGDVPVVSSSGITGTHKEAKVDGPGVVTGRYGTLGKVFYIEEPFWPLNTALYVQNFKGNHRRFVSYFLKWILNGTQSDKAAVPGVNRNDLHARKVNVPDDPNEQASIASVLSAYDDMIDNNRRRIQLLEESTRLLYREWFVHLRFPGHEHARIINGVPEGWERVTVPDVIEINPKEPIVKGADIRYIPMASLSATGMTVDLSETEIRQNSTGVRFRNEDTLFARITPCLENGKTGYVNFLNDGEIACGSTEFIVFRGRRVSPYFTYCLARTYDFRENAIKSMIGSSGRQRVQTSCFTEYALGLPPNYLLMQFDEMVSNTFKMIECLMKQNIRLSKARDILLPRLMNGEVVV